MANFVRSESIVSLNCCKDSEVMDIPRCYYTKWAGDDNVKEDLIILENLYPQVRILFCLYLKVLACAHKSVHSKLKSKNKLWPKSVKKMSLFQSLMNNLFLQGSRVYAFGL